MWLAKEKNEERRNGNVRRKGSNKQKKGKKIPFHLANIDVTSFCFNFHAFEFFWFSVHFLPHSIVKVK
jgi:hypothetical protein